MTSQKGAQLRWGSNETLPRASSPSMQPGGQTLQATPPGWPARARALRCWVPIDLMHWRHVSITTTPCWGSRLVALRAHVLLAERIGAHPLSQCAHPASSAVRHAVVCPLSACLAMVHVACLVWPPTPRGRSSVTSYAYGLCIEIIYK